MSSDDGLERVRRATQADRKAFVDQQRTRRELVAAVREAHAAKVATQAELARMTKTHRNTVASWCGDE